MPMQVATILVIDDTPANLELLFDVLDHAGFEVLVSPNGNGGLNRARNVQPDLILLDVMMPEMDGFETCRQLKTDPATQDIPIIFMTALADTGDKVNGFAVGAVDYITKPIEVQEVLARVNTHLTIHRLQHELKTKNALLADREVHLTHLVEEKTQRIEQITLALVNALEHTNVLDDLDTGNHIKRVGEYSAYIAEQSGCAYDFVKRIKLYAPLHDVGKIGLSDAILKKAEKYTPEERLAMQQHVVFGAQILDREGIDAMARNIARYHHEKWDGTGYMEQLRGEAIPLEARIVALADVYDALISQRVYKDAFTEEQAAQIIWTESGKHFDPTLVKIFFTHQQAIRDLRRSWL